jgi:opacity protein-like surface antigen
MSRYTKFLILFILFSHALIHAQYRDSEFSISTNFSYNTTAKIFLTPDAENILDQNYNFGIENFYSYSAELRYRASEYIILGLSIEYMEGSGDGRNLSSGQFIVTDGFLLYPFELSIYYYLPFSTEDFKFYMGGGLGIYTGKRTRNFGDITFEDVSSETGFGIQVSTGMDYLIFDFLSVRGELRFRDPDFRVTNKYSSSIVNYQGRQYRVSPDNISSKVNMDGITFRIGAVYHFSIFN